jgi:uncharacterized membrane protein
MLHSALLPVHIAGGIVGIASGTAAMLLRKGGDRHALAGKIFVAAMLTMASAAVYLATIKHQPNNIGGGILTFYLILTAWLTARGRDGETHSYDWLLMLVPLVLGVLGWAHAIQVVRGRAVQPAGVPVGMNFFMSSVMLLAAAGDIRLLLGREVLGGKRIVRHLWRMCFGLFIATGSFFLGQQQVFPMWMRGSVILLILGVLPLPLLIFWLFRFRFANTYKAWRMQPASPRRSEPYAHMARCKETEH